MFGGTRIQSDHAMWDMPAQVTRWSTVEPGVDYGGNGNTGKKKKIGASFDDGARDGLGESECGAMRQADDARCQTWRNRNTLTEGDSQGFN